MINRERLSNLACTEAMAVPVLGYSVDRSMHLASQEHSTKGLMMSALLPAFTAMPGRVYGRFLAALGVALVFASDLLTPLGFAHGMLYVPCILLTMVSASRRFVWGLGWVSAGLTVLGLLVSPEAFAGMELSWVLGNRLLSVVVILLTTWLVLRVFDYLARLELAMGNMASSRQALLEQQRLVAIAGRVANLGGWQIHLPGYGLICTETALRLHGQRPEQQPTLSYMLALYTPEAQQTLHSDIALCANEGVAFDRELPLAGGDNWLRVMGEAVYSPEGKIIGLQGAVQDISPRKRSEALLMDSRSRFESLANAMPLVVWTAEPDGTVDYANAFLGEYCGVDRDDILQPGGWLKLLHPDDRQHCVDVWLASVKTGTDYRIRFRLRRRDGVYRLHQVRALPTTDPEGRVVKWYGSAMDIEEPGGRWDDRQGDSSHLS